MNLEMAKEVRSSLIWKEIVGEIDKKVEWELQRLRSCTPDELVQIQARLACYESLTRLPADVIDREE